MRWLFWIVTAALFVVALVLAVRWRRSLEEKAAALARGKAIQDEVTRLALSPDEAITRSGA
jgi:hypothetical protein